ncbi:4-alpha-glucanotransferase [Colwellia sp. RE-S-Sl-9]
MNKASPSVEKLAELVGFHKNYVNSFGIKQTPKKEALASLLNAMGFNLTSEQVLAEQIQTLQEKQWRNILPTTHIIKSTNKTPFIPISIHNSGVQQTISWTITTENGDLFNQHLDTSNLELIDTTKLNESTFSKYQLPIPQIEEGYHKLSIKCGEQQSNCHLIVVPETCFSAEEAHKNKVWGYTAQLYSIRSEQNFGMGDFEDLNKLIIGASKQGASTVGLNPLHPLYQNNPAHISPYSPTSRCFINTLYINVQNVPNFSTCQLAQEKFNNEDFQTKLASARSSQLIDYPAVAELKFELLEILFDDFIISPQEINDSIRQDFICFTQEQGEDLFTLATFEALYEHFRELDPSIYDWKAWPKEYQSPNTQAVKIFQELHATRIQYFMYLQWLAHEQLTNAANLTQTHDMPIGLYLDLAVGCDGSGVDVWSNQEVYVSGAAIGAPPDAMNTLGQNWGLTPMNPVALKEQGYQPLIKALRCNMQYAGALRIDHILGLMRQYWIAPEMGAHEGIYITFPLDDILSIIALESRRSRCVVIGEDLGTVPEGFGEIIAKSGLLSYKVLYFERWWETGLFKRPELYPSQSIATVSTHDVPTLVGWWASRDLTWRRKLNLYPNDELKDQEQIDRIKDRHCLIDALKDVGTLSADDVNSETLEITNSHLNIAVQKYIGLSKSHIQLIPLEDALELLEQVNIPGTIDEHPNWRQKLPIILDELWSIPSILNIASLMNEIRPK